MKDKKTFIRMLCMLVLGICTLLFASCSCGSRGKSDTPAHVHEYTAHVHEPTCTERGYTEYICDCGDSYISDYTEAEHRFASYRAGSLCGAQGEYVFRFCKVCGYTETPVSVLHPHDLVFEPPVDPTCTRYGTVYAVTCRNCSYRLVLESLPPLGHKPSGAYLSYNDTYHYKICARGTCGEKVYFSHRWDPDTIKVIKAATCEKAGTLEKTCRDCGYVKTETVLPHCTLSDWQETKAPTCTQSGEEARVCTVCGKKYTRVVKALGHLWGHYEETKVPNCYEKGSARYTCTRCGEKKDETLAERHTYGEWCILSNATCTEHGTRERVCTLCGYTDTQRIPAHHTWDEGVTVSEATCTDPGQKLYTCTVCGQTDVREEPDALGHIEKHIEREATCTEGGYEMTVCGRCGEILEILRQTGALGHLLPDTYLYDEHEHWQRCIRPGCAYTTEKEAHTLSLGVVTKRQNGEYLHIFGEICACGYVSDEKSVVHEHEAVEVISPTATCLQAGNSAGLRCAVAGCNEILIQPTPIAALGHRYIDGKCVRCGAIDYDALQTKGLFYELMSGEYDDSEYYVVRGIGTATDTDIVIAATHNGRPVREIGEFAFEQNENITSVRVSDSVKHIGEYAFMENTNLECVSIPGSVKVIEETAFFGCENLRNLTLGDGIERLGRSAFASCSKLERVTLPDSVTTIDLGCFVDCQALEHIDLPRNLQTIEFSAFLRCYSLKSVVIPDGVTEIAVDAFSYCYALQTVVLPKNLQTIEYRAFEFCVNLTKIELPSGLKSIGANAFWGTNITTIAIPHSVTSIGKDAFNALSRIEYDGTIEEWQALVAASDWDGHCYCVVHCLNGEIQPNVPDTRSV